MTEAERDRHVHLAQALALGTLGGGLLGVYTVYLGHAGKHQAALHLGLATGIVGAILGAAQVYTLSTIHIPSDVAPATEGSAVQPTPPAVLAADPSRAPVLSGVFGRTTRRPPRRYL
ncbi:MAG TPA: hypothetical protein VEI82_13545 [Myxococcota bacterium]|nr:hypothetical protein [Myxococcota bacterium]